MLASIRLDSGQFKRSRNRKAGSSFGFTGASEPPGPRAPLARCPANTSPLNQELLTLALGIPGHWVRPGPPVPARRLCASPGARGAPGWARACWASFMSSPTERARAGANNVALPSLPVPAPSETLVCKREHAGQGKSGAGLVLLGVGTEARPPTLPPSGHPARAARPPHPQRNGNRFDR